MKKMKNLPIIAIGSVLLVLTAFLTRKKWMPIFFKDKGDEKKAAELEEDKALVNEQGKAWTPPASAAESFPLKLGMAGGKTQAIQKALSIKADGIFGKGTQASIESWGYTIPLSQTDYDAILSGKKKQATKATPTKPAVPKTGGLQRGEKIYARYLGTPIFKGVNDVIPERLAGKDEYLGIYNGYRKSYSGNKFAVLKGLNRVVALEKVTRTA